MNGDAFQDVITCNQGGSTLAIFYGSASGDLASPQVYAVGGAPSSVDVGDFNRDGHVDILAANAYSWSLTVLFHR